MKKQLKGPQDMKKQLKGPQSMLDRNRYDGQCPHSPTGRHVATASGGKCNYCYASWHHLQEDADKVLDEIEMEWRAVMELPDGHTTEHMASEFALKKLREIAGRIPLVSVDERVTSQPFDAATTYDIGDEVIHTPRKAVTLTGKPTEWTEEGEPQVYRATIVPNVGLFEGWEEHPGASPFETIPSFIDGGFVGEDLKRSRRYQEAVVKNGPPKGIMMFGGEPGKSYKIECNTTGRVYYGTADENGKVEAT